MEDSLMRVFASDTVKNMMGRFGIPEDHPIENKMITRSLESAQKKIEGFHFDARKHVLAYDDVLNKQRQVIYDKRRRLLLGEKEEVESMLEEVIAYAPEVEEAIDAKRKEFGEEEWVRLARRLILQITDILWVEHLEVMQYTRSSVGLRAYGQQDPLNEYRKEGTRLFKEMQEAMLSRTAEVIPRVVPEAIAREEAALRKAKEAAQRSGGARNTDTRAKNGVGVRTEPKIGRNELVQVTDGKVTKEMKFKKAEELIASGEWKMVV
jgi:preprotein translocase subunit SecA